MPPDLVGVVTHCGAVWCPSLTIAAMRGALLLLGLSSCKAVSLGPSTALEPQAQSSDAHVFRDPTHPEAEGSLDGPVKVYILPVPRALTDDLLECYREARGAYPWDDSVAHGDCLSTGLSCTKCQHGNECSSSLAVENAQYASDIWLHKGLLKHGGLTADPNVADVIFVPFYGAASYEMGEECQGLSHQERVELLAETVSRSPLWNVSMSQRHRSLSTAPGWRFTLPITHWRVASTLTSPLREMVTHSQAVVLVQDRYFFDLTRGNGVLRGLTEEDGYRVLGWDCLAFGSNRAVVVPYPALIRRVTVPAAKRIAAPHVQSEKVGPEEKEGEDRRHLVYFRGNTQLSTCANRLTKGASILPRYCSLRSSLVLAATDSCSASDLDIEAVDKLTDTSFGYKGNFSTQAQVKGMRSSIFCLAPRGDTPSSRRIYDAIAFGCIPVLISEEFDPPFQGMHNSSLNWSTFSLSFSVLDAVQDSCAILEKLRQVPPERIRELRASLAHARRMLAYGASSPLSDVPGGAVDLTLLAVQAATSQQARGSTSSCGKPPLPTEVVLQPAAKSSNQIFVVFSMSRFGSSSLPDALRLQPNVTMLDGLFRTGVWDETGDCDFTGACDPLGIRKLRCELGYCTDEALLNDVPGFMRTLAHHCPTTYCGIQLFPTQLPTATLHELFAWSGAGEGPQLAAPTKVIVHEQRSPKVQYLSLRQVTAGTGQPQGLHPDVQPTFEEFMAGLTLASLTEELVVNRTALVLRVLRFLGEVQEQGQGRPPLGTSRAGAAEMAAQVAAQEPPSLIVTPGTVSNVTTTTEQAAASTEGSCWLAASPCSPTSAELEQLSSHASSKRATRAEAVDAVDAGPPLTFFLHTAGPFAEFSPMVECSLHAMGVLPDGSVDDVDDHVEANIAEHLTDWWLIQRLHEHPQRTYDREKADLHIIGTPLILAYHWVTRYTKFHKKNSTHDGAMSKNEILQARCDRHPRDEAQARHTEKLSELATHISGMPEFKAHNGTNWMFVTTHYDLAGIFGEELLHLLASHKATLGTVDNDYAQVKELVGAYANPVLILPYKAMHPTESFVRQPRTQHAPPRSIDGLFLGNMKRGVATANRSRAAVNANLRTWMARRCHHQSLSGDAMSVAQDGTHHTSQQSFLPHPGVLLTDAV